MRKMMLSTLLVAASITASSVLAQQAAPAFELPDISGQKHSLQQYAGKIVVLEWVNYECPFIKKFYSVGAMQKWQQQYTDKGVVWLSICSSAPGKQGHYTPEQWQKRTAELKVKATAVLLDEDGSVGRAYGARTTPHMYVIDSTGMLVYNGAIDDKRSTNSTDIEGARNHVTAALEALLTGGKIEVAETKPYGCSVKY